MTYRFRIDEKSLFIGVKNDFKKGQSAMVHTPLNQSADPKKWHNDVYLFLKNYPSIDIQKLPQTLIDKCLRKTTSKSSSTIVYFFVFTKFSVDGVPFNVDASFAMYVKQETSEQITTRDGKTAPNTHFGREKLHYPKSLVHSTDGYNIDNNAVLNKILEVNGGFAYMVNGFDVDPTSGSLNFSTTMIGLKDVPLSNVFKRQKGIGTKLLVNGINFDELNVTSPIDKILTKEENNAFLATIEKIQKKCRSNGAMGEEYVFENLSKILGEGIEHPVHVSKKYPLSPYDIECFVNGLKLYIEVKSSATDKQTFYMSKGERLFMDKYDEHYILILVTNVQSEYRQHKKYKKSQILNESIMSQEPQTIKFTLKKVAI